MNAFYIMNKNARGCKETKYAEKTKINKMATREKNNKAISLLHDPPAISKYGQCRWIWNKNCLTTCGILTSWSHRTACMRTPKSTHS